MMTTTENILLSRKSETEIAKENSDKKAISSLYRNTTQLKPLLPPFLQTKSQSDIPTEKSPSQILNEGNNIDVSLKTSLLTEANIIQPPETLGEFIPTCANRTNIDYEDVNINPEDCRGLCEGQCVHDYIENEYPASETQSSPKLGVESYEYFGLSGSCYQEREESSGQDEADNSESDLQRKDDPLWSLNLCKVPSSSSEHDEESLDLKNTTEPFLAHELYIPYEWIPKPRFFNASGKNVPYIARSLPKRPRSPVRELLPGKFHLEKAYEELENGKEDSDTEKYIRESKERISQTLQGLLTKSLDTETMISSVILEAICEQVTLTIDVNVNIDVNAIVNIATILALVELEQLDDDIISRDQRKISREMAGYYPLDSDGFPLSGKTPGYRNTLLTVYRPKFCRHLCPTMHYRLPWCYISPVHQRGQMKFYPNVRERIDETLPGIENDSSIYVSDVKCFHLRDASAKVFAAYKRRSKAYSVPKVPISENIEEFLINFVSFV